MKLHSSVALITNSSTVIYSVCTESTVQRIKAFINAVLKASGSDQTFNDLYDISLVQGEEYPTPWGETGREDYVRITDKNGNEVKDFQAILDTIHTDGWNDNF
jgi:hypothetical protein